MLLKIEEKKQQFSVLISIYKNENPEYLKLAINSVINQTLKPTEIVLVKDGLLTDELEQCIENFQKKYSNIFNIVEFKKNRGLGLALKDGIKACKYEYIARMDTDDVAELDRFEKQFTFLKRNPQIALLGSWVKEFSDNFNEPDTVTKLPCTYNQILKFARKRNPFRHMTVILKKEEVIKAGNYRDFLWFEDYDLWVRMLLNGCLAANIPEYLVNVRADENMFKRRSGWMYIKQEIKFQKFLLNIKFISKMEFLRNLIIRTIVRILPNFVRVLLYKNILRTKL